MLSDPPSTFMVGKNPNGWIPHRIARQSWPAPVCLLSRTPGDRGTPRATCNGGLLRQTAPLVVEAAVDSQEATAFRPGQVHAFKRICKK
ncbi:MAG: hypothetical protein ACFFCS_10495 [Candidatus Hodarchaeota archaeon]